MKARVIRLYPMYLAALVIGLGLAVLGLMRGWVGPGWADVATVAAFSLLFLPTPPMLVNFGGGALYPFNGPAWSLFFELVANAVYGFIARLLQLARARRYPWCWRRGGGVYRVAAGRRGRAGLAVGACRCRAVARDVRLLCGRGDLSAARAGEAAGVAVVAGDAAVHCGDRSAGSGRRGGRFTILRRGW